MELSDWIGLGVAGIAWIGILWCLFLFGSYEMTGRRGWRRVPVGAVLAIDVLTVRFNRWAAKRIARAKLVQKERRRRRDE